MTMPKNITQVPWTIVNHQEQGTNGRRITLQGQSGMIADFDWNSPIENMANVRLCQAAPRMVETINLCLKAIRICDSIDCTRQVKDSIRTKAEAEVRELSAQINQES